MTRKQLEHLIRAASQIADDDELIIIGSQALLGAWPSAPEEMLVSVEADLFPRNKPELADLIDGTIGELSPFHMTFGYYAHGVAEETATLPRGWKHRLVPIRTSNTLGATGWCLEFHDLMISKLAAGRPKDLDFVDTARSRGRIRFPVLRKRLRETELAEEQVRSIILDRIVRLEASGAC